jgi:uncharacterized protein YgiB involved in biofilm formation
MRTLVTFGILLAAAALAGCGNSAPAVSGPPAERGIYISSSDCAASEKLNLDQCGQLIDNAVVQHQNLAASYATLNACDAAEGQDRCAKGVDGHYHSNIEAFLVTFGQQPSAMPLYGTSDGTAGFKGLDRQNYGINDPRYTVSDSAQAAANDNARGKS